MRDKSYRVVRDRILVRVVSYQDAGIVRGHVLAVGSGWPDERMPRFLFMNLHSNPSAAEFELLGRQLRGMIKDPVGVGEVILFRIEVAEKIPSETGSLFVIRERDVVAIETKAAVDGEEKT